MSKIATSKIRSRIHWLATFVFALFSFFNTAFAQSGDQILDGIGETGLSARYIFDGNLKDWSRNNLHGTSLSNEVKFVNDTRFGKVLSLSGEANSFINLPDAVLKEMESISLSGWVFLRSNQANQAVFDFGVNNSKHFYMLNARSNQPEGLTATIVSAKNQINAISSPIELNKWVHLAVVIDIPSKTLITYINGKPSGEVAHAISDLSEIFASPQSKDKNRLYIGKSFVQGNPHLNANLHDFRIYRVALNSKQVAGIFKNADRGGNGLVNTNTKPEDDLPKFAANLPQFYNGSLVSVPDITIKTAVGSLPRLPAFIDAVYKNNTIGPKVRVIWPAPTDNSSVLKPGTYSVTGDIPGTSFKPKATVIIEPSSSKIAPEQKLSGFKLNQVSLKTDADGNQTKFIENRDKFIKRLSKTDPNSFLYMFRHAFGQKQPSGTKPLGVWDTEDTKLRGHATGHYLSAIAQAYAGTGYDKTLHQNFADKMNYMVNTLYDLSQRSGKPQKAGGTFNADPTKVPVGAGKADFDSDLATGSIRNDYWNWGTGFISAYPPDQFIMLEKGAKYGGQKNQVWAPYYTLHKILAGLIDVYEVSGNKKALAIATNMGDWVFARLNNLPQETLIKMWNTYIAGEYGGMNESMARLYKITKKTEYLKTAQLFDNIKVFYGDASHTHGLAKNVDLFRGLHANQHIPQIVGSIEMYQASKNPEYYNIADNFWHKMISDYMYSIGGVAGARNPANAECFVAQPSTLYENGFSEGGQNETCATYNMLKLTSDLFMYDQRTELMDYYERGLYNHILASVAENSPANTYHVPLRPGSVKQFGNEDMTGFTCCNGTAIESSTKLQNSIYFKSKDNKALYVNLYIPSVLDWTEQKVRIEQTTDFPKEDQTKLTVRGNGKFEIHVRVPGWATKGFLVKINGVAQKVNVTPGSYLALNRSWKDGDTIELKMPFTFHLDPVMDQQNIASLFYGPILLAAQEPEARKDWRKITFNANDIGKSIKGNPKELNFTIDDVVFKPFYNTYGRHSVYLDVTLK
ncbi:beta-L-arabinofuranosidase domain-containing protein [Pedobacter sp. Leaf170]|uniref:beta-L-arabinofuranosidase domain-containing protein n=1 Tax=Pedobacter sp. Leaf170 TaxID=2876558 RepID=UPI001E30ADEB|nr:beta-L-arabinofuranosidase domain-containing protein [Pedobacter sp. Leaf170]